MPKYKILQRGISTIPGLNLDGQGFGSRPFELSLWSGETPPDQQAVIGAIIEASGIGIDDLALTKDSPFGVRFEPEVHVVRIAPKTVKFFGRQVTLPFVATSELVETIPLLPSGEEHIVH